ncbi:MAG: succinate dehydrogenase/fumarate reductase flavoprotein subunit, partial [Defluviitaleaceae bacterium]|nr:succinate dehydrogenase/fumarate reductase flavoprotein subunit [Defluviitaleaceae bacterium]
RLMGNSLLDIIVFGRLAGKAAAKAAGGVSLSKLTLSHVQEYAEALKSAEIETGKRSPQLLPRYTRAL